MSSDFKLFEEILQAMRKPGASKRAQGLGNNIKGFVFVNAVLLGNVMNLDRLRIV
jgi:hypothetical protein